MKMVLIAAGLLFPAGMALYAEPAAAALTGFPFTDEALVYNIAWQQGVRLGQARLNAKHAASGWAFDLDIDAGLPGFPVKDVYTSHTNSDFCSTDFTRQYQHGARKGREDETVDRSTEVATRVTAGGGRSEFPVPDCIKDALTLLYYARRELGQGRVPAAQPFLFGGMYDITMAYTGAATIPVAGVATLSDRVVCSVRGPQSSLDFEVYFARDPARTPLLVKIPMAVGTFSMELAR
jgi:hypothetical protein